MHGLVRAVILALLMIVSAAVEGRAAVFEDDPGVRSWSEWRWLGIAKQATPWDCGAAAWRTWVQALGLDEASIQQALLSVPLPAGPSNLHDLYRLSQKAGLEAIAVRFPAGALERYLERSGLPVLLHLEGEGGHFVVVTAAGAGGREGKLLVADPAAGWRVVSREALWSEASGAALVSTAAGTGPSSAGGRRAEWEEGRDRAQALGETFTGWVSPASRFLEISLACAAEPIPVALVAPGEGGLLCSRTEALPGLLEVRPRVSAGWTAERGLGVQGTVEAGARDLTLRWRPEPGGSWAGWHTEAGFCGRWEEAGSRRRDSFLIFFQAMREEDPVLLFFTGGVGTFRLHAPDGAAPPAGPALEPCLELSGGADLLITPSIMVGATLGLHLAGDGTASFTPAAHFAWLGWEGRSWRIEARWPGGDHLGIVLTFRQRWPGGPAGGAATAGDP